ncbi:MAG: hypothetical protein IPK07_03580 [Deltaproteobacteria bacterium]|nr:hypothetical protein [Deltaproteobacteria bacterium]
MTRSFRSAVLAPLSLAVLVGAGASSASAGWEHHRPYQGEWAGSEAFREIRATVERERTAALGTISRSLGLELRGDPRLDGIVFEYLDEGTAGPLGFPAASRGGFRPPADAAQPERVITVIVERFLKSRDELPGFVCHEMIHAVMSLEMGERFVTLEPWVQEGLAVYGAGQGPDKLARLVATEGAAPKGFPDGLDKQEDRLADYVEAYLGIAYLAQARGPQSVRAFTADVIRGVPVEKAIASAAQATWPQFAKAAGHYASERLLAIAPRRPSDRLVVPDAEPLE